MNRRALVVALLVSLFGAVLLVIYLRRFEDEASGGEPVKLLVARKPIEAGALITDEMLAARAVPTTMLRTAPCSRPSRPR